jgi:hypothetical protein
MMNWLRRTPNGADIICLEALLFIDRTASYHYQLIKVMLRQKDKGRNAHELCT